MLVVKTSGNLDGEMPGALLVAGTLVTRETLKKRVERN
jgi:hypothetical protein